MSDEALDVEQCGAPSAPDFDSAPVVLGMTGLTKTFRKGQSKVEAFQGVDLAVHEGEFVSVLGPSGCGKSTLLHVVAGLEEATSGAVEINGEHIPAPPDRTGYFGYMFQKDLLMPWATIIDNVSLGLVVQGVRKEEARSRAGELLDRYGLGFSAKMYPAQLSGGMRQRAALIRTLLIDRPIMLLDEPFGALDALTRSLMQEWLLSLWEQDRKTILFVTHDLEEAVFLSDRVVVMTARPGRIKLSLPIDIPRPRDYETVATPEFVRLKQQLLQSIHDEGVRALEPEQK